MRARDGRVMAGQLSLMLAKVTGTGVRQVIVLTGRNMFGLDLAAFVNFHRNTGCDVAVAAMAIPAEFARFFPVLRTDAQHRIEAVVDRPAVPPPAPQDPHRAIILLGAFVFNLDWLRAALVADAASPWSDHVVAGAVLKQAVDQRQAVAFMQPTVLPVGASGRAMKRAVVPA